MQKFPGKSILFDLIIRFIASLYSYRKRNFELNSHCWEVRFLSNFNNFKKRVIRLFLLCLGLEFDLFDVYFNKFIFDFKLFLLHMVFLKYYFK